MWSENKINYNSSSIWWKFLRWFQSTSDVRNTWQSYFLYFVSDTIFLRRFNLISEVNKPNNKILAYLDPWTKKTIYRWHFKRVDIENCRLLLKISSLTSKNYAFFESGWATIKIVMWTRFISSRSWRLWA